MSIVGAILGDIAGSQFEFNRCQDPDGIVKGTKNR